MKKTVIAIVLTSFITVSQAAIKNNTWYTGSKIGWSQDHDIELYGNHLGDHLNNVMTRNNQIGAANFIGYQADQNLSFELGYNWLGHMAFKNNVNDVDLKVQGISLATKLSYPLFNDLGIYTRLGGMIWRMDYASTYNNGYQSGRVSSHDIGASPMIAVGLEYAWTKNWDTRLDYQWINNIGDASNIGTHPDNAFLGIGVSYYFTHDENPIISSPLTPIIQTKNFSLKSDILFNFNKTRLKLKNKQALDQLYNKLNSIDSQDNTITVIGYTDRIGSSIYNQKLSQTRAQNVVKYLIKKGISNTKIFSKGMGKSNPITGNTCNFIKNNAAKISCLSPDRRVEIKIKGTKNVVTEPQI